MRRRCGNRRPAVWVAATRVVLWCCVFLVHGRQKKEYIKHKEEYNDEMCHPSTRRYRWLCWMLKGPLARVLPTCPWTCGDPRFEPPTMTIAG